MQLCHVLNLPIFPIIGHFGHLKKANRNGREAHRAAFFYGRTFPRQGAQKPKMRATGAGAAAYRGESLTVFFIICTRCTREFI